jgi:amino acid transporter
VFLRLRLGSDFEPGPWSLGRYSKPIGMISVVWVVIITVLFFSPAFYPWDTLVDFNFAGPIFVAILAAVFIWYAVSARKWFTGPKVQGTPEEMAAIERELMLEGD